MDNQKTDFQDAMRKIRNVILTRDANTDFKYSSTENDVNAEVKNGIKKKKIYIVLLVVWFFILSVILAAVNVLMIISGSHNYGILVAIVVVGFLDFSPVAWSWYRSSKVKAVEAEQAPPASKKLVSPQDFDPVFSLPEDKCIDSFISSEMKRAGIADGKGMLPAEVLRRKNILNVIFAVLVYIYLSLIFFHLPLIIYVVGLVVLITYSILSSRYSLMKYIKKEVTSRPQEKISNIIMNVKASLVTDYSKKLKPALMAAAAAGALITFLNPKIMYEEAENGVNVRFYTFGLMNMTSAVIPESYKGEAVVGLRGNTFSNMFLLNEVTLPDTITEIRGQAFKNCISLESIELPAKLTYLGGGAFYNCSSLEQLELPDTLELLGGESFYGCTSLRYIKLSDKLTEIRGNTFENCQSLVSIEIPDSVERIGGHAFYGNESLAEVVISPDSRLSEIGSSAFRLCSSLYEITLPKDVYINERAFKETYAEIRYYE